MSASRMRLRFGALAARPCKVCGAAAHYAYTLDEQLVVGALDLYTCGRCGLHFVGNEISQGEFERAYATQDAERYYREIAQTTDAKATRTLEDLRQRGLLATGKSVPSLLDVGCGYGLLLDRLRLSAPGLHAVGHELPGESAEAARAKGHQVYTCSLGEIAERFTAVTLLDVAEHVPDPLRTFAECAGLIAPGGCIYIHTPRRCIWDTLFLSLVRVPFLSRLAYQWLRTRVSVFHVQLWTDAALRIALSRAGFRIRYVRAERELSWPIERYARVYLGEHLGLPEGIVRMAALAGRLLTGIPGVLRNKSVCLADLPSPLSPDAVVNQE